MSPLSISVVIPAYNAAPYLTEAVESVRRQSNAVLEIIVVDDESPDGTFALAESLGVVALRSGRNGGPARARNMGIRASRGDVVAFLDADDTWEPHHCQEMSRLLESLPTAGIVFGHVATFGARVENQYRLLPDSQPISLWPDIAEYNYVPQTACVVRKELLTRVGGYDEDDSLRPSEDYDLWVRLARLTLVACTHKTTANYRAHPGQVTSSIRKVVTAQTRVRTKLLRTLVAEGSPDVEVVSAKIRAGWEALVHAAWVQGDREAWHAAMDLCGEVPGSDELARKWRKREAILPAKRLWRNLKSILAGRR